MLSRLLPTVLLSALAATVSGAAVAAPACSAPAAKAAFARLKPKVPGLDSGLFVPTPSQADAVVCGDFTRDGRTDMAVTVASGGTAGDIAFVVFVATGSGWRTALARGGYKLGLVRHGSDLVTSQPVYLKNDPNCCPTGGFDHERWHWNGTRFVVAASFHDKTYYRS